MQPPSTPPRTSLRSARLLLLALPSLGVAAYAVVAYGVLAPGALVHPDMRASFAAHRVALDAHVFGAAVALLLGPWQFSARLRAAKPRLHRWAGRVYLGVGVLIGGLAGLVMSTHAFGGTVSRAGFAGLALAWLYSGARAYLSIRRGDVATHRRWMVRNFALTFAAVTLRIYLPVSMVSGIAFEAAYPVIAWACWLPNLVVAEWLLGRPCQPGAARRGVP